MNETLSTLIAFVGFLIVLSMLVQTFQEGLKSIFKMKSGVWERFFVSLYAKELSLPEGAATSLCKRVKESPLVGDFRARMQYLRDMVVAADALMKEFTASLRLIAESSDDDPEFPTKLLSEMQKMTEQVQKLSGMNLESLLSIYNRLDGQTISGFSQALNNIVGRFPEWGDKMKTMERKAAAGIRQECADLLDQITSVQKKIADYRLRIENKVDAWIAQVDEEYRRRMLLWTVLIGLGFVVIFNADAFSIYRHLGADSKTQSVLVQKAAEVTSKAMTTKADTLNDIDRDLKSGNPGKARPVMVSAAGSLELDFYAFNAADAAAAAKALKNKIAADTDADLPKDMNELTSLYFRLQKAAVDNQLEGVATLELPLGWTYDWNRLSHLQGKDCLSSWLQKIAGLLLMTVLITFGAPFWNDILTMLTGIKKITNK